VPTVLRVPLAFDVVEEALLRLIRYTIQQGDAVMVFQTPISDCLKLETGEQVGRDQMPAIDQHEQDDLQGQ